MSKREKKVVRKREKQGEREGGTEWTSKKS